ncbi:ATP-dependent RNA helicase DDX18 isoform X2 [Manduca sexta]|uniref:ATP-dependent RNA helicase DDX18 isoform X2 n=1 Tax=Manduca sexta TaxID=7130 RepID=UPI00188F22D9|nr:ATP-dependent RNA helicase DDX18 isoform X2 [Manduca sexta]
MSIDDVIAKSSFSMLEGKIDARILKVLKSMGFERPTRIQAETLPHLLQQKDLIGAAKTGSGKTLAFLIPIVDNLIKHKITQKHGTFCIILSPTRELALQTFDVLTKLLVEIDLSHCLIVGGEKKAKDVIKLQKANRQTVLFSATIDSKVKNLARLALRNNPVHISVKDDTISTVSRLQQGYCICPVEQRLAWLYKMLKKSKKFKVMVFFSSCKSVDFHYEFFKMHCKATVLSIHGKQSQARRKEAYHSFIKAKNGALFCTDVAARGLDIPCVDWIVQYDPPTDPKEYIHRVGRTARGLNNKGNAVILLRPEEEEFVKFLEKEKVYLDKYSFGDPPGEVQEMVEDIVIKNGVFKILARKAFLSFLRCYNKHPLNKIFNINNMDLKSAAKAFGFREQPDVDFLNNKKR